MEAVLTRFSVPLRLFRYLVPGFQNDITDSVTSVV